MLVLVLLILVALAFDFMNGFHDAANSIATIVSTRVLTPRAAVAWAAFFNFVAAFVFLVVTPVVGFLLGARFMLVIIRLVYRATPATIDRAFRRLQLVSAAGYSLGHGTNDAQKTMGIIAVLLFTSGYLGEKFYVPFWVILICHAAIALGTAFGGWRIVRTMGMRLTALQPVGGFCAETAGAIALLGSATFGIPVSTTHTITGAIVGVGSTRRFSAVRWGVAQNVVLAWILTIPCTAAISALIYLPFRLR